jgi:hypothetical protein
MPIGGVPLLSDIPIRQPVQDDDRYQAADEPVR